VKLQTVGAWCRNVGCSVCQNYVYMNIRKDMRFWILTTVSVNIIVFWDVASVVRKIGTIILPAAAGFTHISST